MIHAIDLHFLGHEHTIASFLIETSEGPVLVETGPHSTIGYLERGLLQYGYQLSDVKKVFLTHIHLDHAGAAWAFAKNGATIYVHPFGAKNMEDPSRLMESARRIYQDKMDELWGEMNAIPAAQLHEVADEEVFDLGDIQLKAWHTPGHAKHHIAWQLGDDLFTGDVAGVKIDQGIVVPPCPPPDINIEHWVDSINLIRKLNPKRLHLTHFDAITDIKSHLDNLEHILWDWANWMKKPFEENRS
ncbi:MAG: MBL fold metallo-hydrolase, partial [Bacteroidota bacterium]